MVVLQGLTMPAENTRTMATHHVADAYGPVRSARPCRSFVCTVMNLVAVHVRRS